MRQYKNKENGIIENADSFTKEFAFSHNSNYELVAEKQTTEKQTTNKKAKEN